MAKLDLSQDYYGDLELDPTSDNVEIKKQYKKLALVYHPDRNVGRSNSDTTRFQRIQAAYEVLIDPLERAKYDANRRVYSFTCAQNGRSKTETKGNPWSNMGKHYPPPPKAPAHRHNQAPPYSNGARRYEKFANSRQSAYQATQEGPQARKATYDAWENMRSQNSGEKSGQDQSKSKGTPDLPPRRHASQSDRKEKKSASPTQPKTSNDSKDEDSKINTQNSNRPQNRKKGFMPSSPGGDEMPAPKGHYFTQRSKQSAPPVPPRNEQPSNLDNLETDPGINCNSDPRATFERRISTPYATHGGERLNPFENPPTNISRSASTRERGEKYQSEKNLFRSGFGAETSPKKTPRAHSSCKLSKTKKRHSNTINVDSTDSEGTIDIPSTPINSNQEHLAQKEDHTSSTKNKPEPQNEFSKTQPQIHRKSHQGAFPTALPNQLPNNSEESGVNSGNEANIIDDDTFTSTKPSDPKLGINNRTEKISTKFSAEDWSGKFSAGSNINYFSPDPHPGLKTHHGIQLTKQVRDQSPDKFQLQSDKYKTSDKNNDNLTKKEFSAEEWVESFKPQTFMPPPSISVSGLGSISANNRRRVCTTVRPGTGVTTNSVSDCSNSEDNQPKVNDKSGDLNTNITTAEIPEPMDIDTPGATTTNPIVPEFQAKNSHVVSDFLKRRVSYSTPSPDEDEIQTSTLKVNFSDLKIKDLIIDFPQPPSPPVLQQGKRPSHKSFREYEKRFQQYMSEWDQFDKKFLLHLVTRKNNNEALGDRRWQDAEAKFYRITIREDQAVLKKWTEAKENHEKSVTNWIIFKDFMQAIGKDERPRKKSA